MREPRTAFLSLLRTCRWFRMLQSRSKLRTANLKAGEKKMLHKKWKRKKRGKVLIRGGGIQSSDSFFISMILHHSPFFFSPNKIKILLEVEDLSFVQIISFSYSLLWRRCHCRCNSGCEKKIRVNLMCEKVQNRLRDSATEGHCSILELDVSPTSDLPFFLPSFRSRSFLFIVGYDEGLIEPNLIKVFPVPRLRTITNRDFQRIEWPPTPIPLTRRSGDHLRTGKRSIRWRTFFLGMRTSCRVAANFDTAPISWHVSPHHLRYSWLFLLLLQEGRPEPVRG